MVLLAICEPAISLRQSLKSGTTRSDLLALDLQSRAGLEHIGHIGALVCTLSSLFLLGWSLGFLIILTVTGLLLEQPEVVLIVHQILQYVQAVVFRCQMRY